MRGCAQPWVFFPLRLLLLLLFFCVRSSSKFGKGHPVSPHLASPRLEHTQAACACAYQKQALEFSPSSSTSPPLSPPLAILVSLFVLTPRLSRGPRGPTHTPRNLSCRRFALCKSIDDRRRRERVDARASLTVCAPRKPKRSVVLSTSTDARTLTQTNRDARTQHIDARSLGQLNCIDRHLVELFHLAGFLARRRTSSV